MFDQRVVQLAGLAAEQLHGGLLTQFGERLRGQVRDRFGGRELRECRECLDAGRFELVHLARTDAGHLVQAVFIRALLRATVVPVALRALGARRWPSRDLV